MQTLELTCETSGNAAVLAVDTKIAIDAQGNIVCANSTGVYLVTNTGLAPGYSAWWRPVFWKKPRGRFLGSGSMCSTDARAVLKTVFLVAARLDDGGSTDNDNNSSSTAMVGEQRRCSRSNASPSRQQGPQPLPTKLWHQILGMLQPWQLGSSGVVSQ